MFNQPVNNYQVPTPTSYPVPAPNMQAAELAQSYGVSPVDVANYAARLQVDPGEAAKHVSADQLWRKVATEAGVLGKDPTADAMTWHEHYQFAHAGGQHDPLHDYPDAATKFQEESLRLAQERLTNENR